MSSSPKENASNNEASNCAVRLENVESLLAHTQRDLEQLSQVVWQQQAELDSLRKELFRVNARVATLGEVPEARDPLAEKPPHY